jgi:lycopene cyclase domain-containing protein
VTYLAFLFVFVVPLLAVFGSLAWRRRRDFAGQGRWAVPLTALLALVYTTPWDNYLVWKGVWIYGPERVIGVIGYVPVEEYLFFILQPLTTGSLLVWLIARRLAAGPVASAAGPRLPLRVGGAAAGLAFAAWGVVLLTAERTLYLGLILAWAAPLAALMWLVLGHEFARYGREAALAVAGPTLWLWAADRYAIGDGIWSIAPRYTTGLVPLGLPVEEAVFFLVTNVMVVFGVLLFLSPTLPGFRHAWRRA